MQANGTTANGLALQVVGTAVAASGALAAVPAVQATSGSVQPAVKAVGKVVPVSGAVPIAGNAAALTVQGVAAFTRSGVANILAGTTSAIVPVPGGLSINSHALATLQGIVTGPVAVKSVGSNTLTGKITIYLTAVAPVGGLSVAWFVFG